MDAVGRLIGQPTGELVPVADDYYLTLAQACQARMATWPVEALAEYRGRVDATARSLLDVARASRDEAQLQRVLDSYFVSSYGDDTLLALADLALEAGHHDAARGYLLRISPAMAAADGRPWGVVLAGVDFQSEQVIQSLAEAFGHVRPTSNETRPRTQDQLPIGSPLHRVAANMGLTYPDTNLPLSDLLARLAMVSIREGSLDRAGTETAVLRKCSRMKSARLVAEKPTLPKRWPKLSTRPANGRRSSAVATGRPPPGTLPAAASRRPWATSRGGSGSVNWRRPPFTWRRHSSSCSS